MPYDFFFSYTRADNNGYLKKFFHALNEEVCSKAGYPNGTLAGYFDQDRLERGMEWSEALVGALQESSTLVCLYSPAYFKSTFCGREWAVFEDRRRLYLAHQKAAGIPAAEPPAVIKPVLWVPILEPLPASVDRMQYAAGDPQATHNTEGLRYMRARYEKYKVPYLDFIDHLAAEILAARARYHAVLPRLPGALAFDSVRDAFERSPAAAGAASPHQQHGPNAVRFVFVAAKPEEFPPGARATDCYRQRGGRDWRPYFPDWPKPIGALAQSVAAGDLDFFSEEIPFSVTLPTEVRRAEDQASIVVLVVDSWTVALPSYRRVLEEFDKGGYFNCSVLIPWNDADVETLRQHAVLEADVRGVFRRQSRHPLYFRDSISSEEELRAQLRDVLIRLRSEVFNQAPVTRSVPGGEPKPGLQGPGAAAVGGAA
jgi:FxsC-like protein